MKRFCYAVLCLAAALTVAAAQQPTAPATRESTPAVRQQTFVKVWETVRDKFFDPNFNGVDWLKVREHYAPLVAAVKTDAELYDVLNKMLGELHVSHMEIITPDEMAQWAATPTTTGLGLRNVEGRVVVLRVLPGSSAERMGVRPGFVVQQIDGADVRALSDALAKLGGAVNTTVRVSFLDEHDAPRELTLERLPLTSAQVEHDKIGNLSVYALFEAKRIADGIGYIRFTTFIEALNPKLRAAVESMHDAPGLIIDLRGNGGGDDSVALKLVNLLFDRPTGLMITRTRKGDNNDYRARPAEHPYLGPLVILVDELSGSASEQITAGLQESGRAYVVGKQSQGDDMDADLLKLPTGADLIYAVGQPRTPKGVIIEGRGVIPDLAVNLTRAELLQGNDAQLTAAVAYIKRKATTADMH
ncbi:MAG: S41 family peptidase [Pyrinomonadaceae bacterium]